MMNRVVLKSIILIIVTLSLVTAVYAEDIKPRTLVTESESVLDSIMKDFDNAIPNKLLKECSGVMIFPSIVKAGLVLGGTYGKGVVMARTPEGDWSPPAFVSLGGASLGFQIGVQSIELILVIMSDDGLKSLLDSGFKLGADAGLAAGPVGKRAEMSTDITFGSKIYSYSRTKGVFGGVSFEGSGISVDDEYIKKYYGSDYDYNDILYDHSVSLPDSAVKMVDVLNRYSKEE